MRTAILGSGVLVVIALAACQADKPPPRPADPTLTVATPTTVATTPPETTAAPAPPAASSAPSDYSSCTTDADCEVVPRAGCCDNGYKEAIARGKGDAYRAANACAKKVMCPHIMVVDRRTAACNVARHVCEMVGSVAGSP
jgi:hypothetical protein